MEGFVNFIAMLIWLFGVGLFHLRVIEFIFALVVTPEPEPEPRWEFSPEARRAIIKKVRAAR